MKDEANINVPFQGAPEKGSNSSAQEKSGGHGLRKRWVVAEVVCGILSFVFMSHFFILV